MPKWISHNTNATLYLPTMEKPRHGKLLCDNNVWSFHPGRKETNPAISLPEFVITP